MYTIVKSAKTLYIITILCLLLGACRAEEIDVSEVETSIDTTNWPRYCLGYHSFIIPPEMEERGIAPSVLVDYQEITILPNFVGTPRKEVESRNDFGGVVFEKEINGWLIMVVARNLGLSISENGLIIYGVRKVGSHLVMTHTAGSRKKIGDGNHPLVWEYHTRTTPMLLEDRGDREGYCFEGLFFESGPPKYLADFMLSAGVLEPPSLDGSRMLRTDNDLSIRFAIEPNIELGSGRPLAPQNDISNLPGVTVKSEAIRVLGGEGGLATVMYESEDEKALWYDAAIYGEEMSISDPQISIKYTNYVDFPEESREKMLAILAGLMRN